MLRLCSFQTSVYELTIACFSPASSLAGGELITLIYPLRPGADTGEDLDGPPFAMSEKIVRGLLEKNGFVATLMERVDPKDATAEYRIGKEILARWRLADSK